MKSNFNDLFDKMLPDLKDAKDISIDNIIDEIMPEFDFTEKVTKARLSRWFVRNRLTTALNKNHIYSYDKGKFVSIENANEQQLKRFMEKARRDIAAATVRKTRAEQMLEQYSMAWDEEGNFIGFHTKVVNE